MPPVPTSLAVFHKKASGVQVVSLVNDVGDDFKVKDQVARHRFKNSRGYTHMRVILHHIDLRRNVATCQNLISIHKKHVFAVSVVHD